MFHPPITKLVEYDNNPGCFQGKCQWRTLVNGGNGCLYGIPFNAPKVLQFKQEDKSIAEIGPNLGVGGYKYMSGIQAANGSIYCLPYKAKYFLKIKPMEGGGAKVSVLKDQELPVNSEYATFDFGSYKSGCLANDGCLYYFPDEDLKVLKLDPNNGDCLSLVGERVENASRMRAVRGSDDCIYGIPAVVRDKYDVLKFNPVNNCISTMSGKIAEAFSGRKRYRYIVGGVMAEDGNIYAATEFGQVLKINVVKNECSFIGRKIYSGDTFGWGSPIIGENKCIYFPPSNHNQVLVFNPSTQEAILVGNSYGNTNMKWLGATLASDGFIYCIPFNADGFLQIDTRHINEQVLDFVQNIKEAI